MRKFHPLSLRVIHCSPAAHPLFVWVSPLLGSRGREIFQEIGQEVAEALFEPFETRAPTTNLALVVFDFLVSWPFANCHPLPGISFVYHPAISVPAVSAVLRRGRKFSYLWERKSDVSVFQDFYDPRGLGTRGLKEECVCVRFFGSLCIPTPLDLRRPNLAQWGIGL